MRRSSALGIVVVVAMAAGCVGGPRPMAATNRTDEPAYIRLVFADSSFQDFLLPARASVTLVTTGKVDWAAELDATCHWTGADVFDAGSPFTQGGEIWIAPLAGGRTTTVPSVLGPPAATSSDCLDVPTPQDPRTRVPLGGGGVGGDP